MIRRRAIDITRHCHAIISLLFSTDYRRFCRRCHADIDTLDADALPCRDAADPPLPPLRY